jgi:hypothetical protein
MRQGGTAHAYADPVTRLDLRSSSGQMPVAAVVALAVALAAVVGLIAGALWGLSGGGGGTAASSTPTPVPTSSPSTTPSPSTASPSGSSTPEPPSPSGSSTTGPTPTGSAPPAPATTSTSADGWRLGSWRITNAGGTLGVTTTARNIRTQTRSADLVLYVYVDGQLIATTTATVTDVPAGGTVPVQFTGTDPWKPGQKVLLLVVP